MIHRLELADTLFSSIAGVLVFLSLAYYIDLNGFTQYSILIMAAGSLILIFLDKLMKISKELKLLSKPVFLTISHILIFVGSKMYLDEHVKQNWILFFLLGVFLLNNHRLLASKLFEG